ncbi:MAG: cytochrome c [Gammaproteobacteria bacterium]|nr:cytochrome c [Gammaproteobacteria bacterium]MCP4089224.1 cytochrome c [Gammaproteobacteria bacterium]MCP4276752.1 cytochrome c [Gammaproteobacteria bacterium]MCP4830595.1 cytochrome c [Gammaproteobacteria bacterium]MCP4928404.1 cytochrome c [Gammaproteobacteria bacterium]
MIKSLLASFYAILVMVICLVLYLYLGLPRQNLAADIQVSQTPEQVERGRYLVEHVAACDDCHSKRDWNFYGGPVIPPLGAGHECLSREEKIIGVRVQDDTIPGVLCIRNLTPDKRSGVGRWTDGELLRAIREGVDPNGHAVFPVMPYSVYKRFSDEDVSAVVAYMRQLPPVSSEWFGRGIEFPMGLLSQFWPEPLMWPIIKPDIVSSAQYGSYLAAIGRCEHCHTVRRKFGRNLAPEGRFAGGVVFEVNGQEVVSSNLTPHESGLGNMSRAEFIAKFKSFSQPQKSPPEGNTPMNWTAYSGMTETDLGAIYDYLQTRRPVDTSSK